MSHSALTFSPVRDDDIEAIVQIEGRSFTDPWSTHGFRQLVDNTRVHFLCAREGVAGPVLGYVVAWFAADEGEIANLAVIPEARGRGIGGLLLERAFTEAKRRGATAIYLEVRDSNRTARQLYESRGFQAVGRRKAYYRRPVEDAIILRRAVTQEAPLQENVNSK